MENTSKKATKNKSKLSFTEKKTMRNLGEYINQERRIQNLSLEELSIKSFQSPHQKKAISLIERGLSEEVQFITIARIFNGLGIDLGF